MNILGIDPGQSGGIVLVPQNGLALVAKMPETERDIFELLETCSTIPGQTKAYIEKVHSMPGQGVASSFKFGAGYGGLRMALIALRIPFEDVTPQKWQKELGIVSRSKTESKTQHKNKLKARAQELFPTIKMTLNICDALLIAEWARRRES